MSLKVEGSVEAPDWGREGCGGHRGGLGQSRFDKNVGPRGKKGTVDFGGTTQ